MTSAGSPCTSAHASARWQGRTTCWSRDRIRARIRRPRRSRTQGCARRMAPLRRRFCIAVAHGVTAGAGGGWGGVDARRVLMRWWGGGKREPPRGPNVF
jgi:hypothetical protein